MTSHVRSATTPIVVNISGRLGLFIAPMVLGHDTLAVSATSRSFIKHGGAGATDCFIPLAMASCLVDRYGLSGLQNVTLKLQPAGIDNVGMITDPMGAPTSKKKKASREH